jgi:putative membrane protein
MHLLARFIVSVAALYVTVYTGRLLGLHLWLDPGLHGVIAALIAAAVLGIVNAVIRPVLELIALPITCLTLGLFGIVINAVLFWLVGQFVPGFHVRGAAASVYGTLVMGLTGALLGFFLVPRRPSRDSRRASE